VEQPTKFELVINLKAEKTDWRDHPTKPSGQSRSSYPMIRQSKPDLSRVAGSEKRPRRPKSKIETGPARASDVDYY